MSISWVCSCCLRTWETEHYPDDPTCLACLLHDFRDCPHRLAMKGGAVTYAEPKPTDTWDAERARLEQRIEELEREVAANTQTWFGKIQAERDEAQAEVAKLQSVTCVYCGYEYGPSGETPRAKAEILTEHIARCPEHPLAEARAYARRLYAYCSPAEWGQDADVLADAPEWVKG